MIRPLALMVGWLIAAAPSSALAWSCDGHRAVVFVAERLLSAKTLGAAKAVLTASPPDPALRRSCTAVPSDVLADAATWADDYRDTDPGTAGWHFINFPRSAGGDTAAYKKYCPNGNCIVDAIVAQFQTLTNTSDPKRRANALRFILHLVGDIHQPLHAITNGDRGGNCLPVTYFTEVPQEDDRHGFSPNLHRVWDGDSIRRLMSSRGLADARALAGRITQPRLPQTVAAAAPTAAEVNEWARASNLLARDVAYGRLAVKTAIEPGTAITLSSCDDNNHVARRIAGLHERIDGAYEQASVPVIVSQLRLAGVRLAAVLKAAFPGA
jgi:nuclease S1